MSTDELAARAHARANAVAAAAERVAALRGVGTSERGVVEAEVDGHGTLVGLWLAPGAAAEHPDELARLVVQAAQAAAGWVAERRAAVLALVEGDAVAQAWDDALGRPRRGDVAGAPRGREAPPRG